MKSFITLALSLLFTASTAFASETMKGAKKDFAEFKKEMSVKLEEIEKNLSELKAKAAQKGGETQDKTVKELESTRDTLKTKVQQLSDDGKDTWKKMKVDIIDSAETLTKKLKKALE